MKIFIIISLLCVLGMESAWGQNKVITLYAQPTSDGELIDESTPWDGIPDSILDSDKSARITASFRDEKAAVVEFPLPPAKAVGIPTLRKARLVLYSHEKGIAPITVQLFAYWGDTADGVVNLNDWGQGEYLGDILVRDISEISVQNRWPAFDVTEAVQKAMSEEANAIGFFLRASKESRHVEKGLIRIRTAEFAMNSEQYKPSLELYFE